MLVALLRRVIFAGAVMLIAFAIKMLLLIRPSLKTKMAALKAKWIDKIRRKTNS